MASKITITTPNFGSQPLRLLHQLGLTGSTESELASLLSALGVDPLIPGYKDITDVLSTLLSDDVTLPWEMSRRWRKWRTSVKRLSAKGDSLGAWANPTEGKAQAYPILACLLTPSARPQEQQHHALKQLLLVGCILHEAGISIWDDIVKAANEIRLAAKEADERSVFVLQLPVGPLGMTYLFGLSEAATRLSTAAAPGSRGKRLMQAIQVLTANILRSGHLIKKRIKHAPADPEESLPVLGQYEAVVTEDPDQDAEFDQLVVMEEPPSEPGTELSDEGLNAATIQTGYWLAQTQSSVLWQRNRISPLEFPRLQRVLHQLPELAENGTLTAGQALIIALVAATGLDVEEILTLTIGPQSLLSWDGVYRRPAPALESAYQPPDELIDAFASEAATVLTWQLPDTVSKLLNAIRPYPFSGATTLAAALHLDIGTPDLLAKTLKELREMIGHLLRQHVGRRLQHRHLKTVLRYRTYETTHDPALTFLISGRPNQAPPVQLYYAGITVQRLEELHRTVTRSLFGEM